MFRSALPIAFLTAVLSAAEPIRLHPDNPHYYLFRGKPTILLTSAEHYGAVLNAEFDYVRYLDALARDGLNLTRIFSGVYRELPGDFSIPDNTLAPAEGKFLAPFAVKGDKYDLRAWNPAFFDRLKRFVTEAGARGIVVELSLFCVYYQDRMWEASPFHPKYNVNSLGDIPRQEALSLKHPALLKIQEEFVRKVVGELRDFDNILYEICNEPYVRNLAADDWQRHIAKVIADAEATFPHRHLIAQNIANFTRRVREPDPNVSILNFHYARPPVAAGQNWALNRVIGLDETGFDGTLDGVYRIQAWDFLLAGGAHYNNLDYSFTVRHPDGTFAAPGTAPGGGSAELRRQLSILRDFFGTLNFVRMNPAADFLLGPPAEGLSARTLAEPGKSYAIYLHTGRALSNYRPRYAYRTDNMSAHLAVNLPAGDYAVQWWSPRSGKLGAPASLNHPGGRAVLVTPEFSEDLAVTLSAGQR